MGYQTDYIIDPEVQDEGQPIVQKEMEPVSIPNNRIQREYEVIDEPVSPTQNVLDEIHEAAIEEGLVEDDEELIGGENATPNEVIQALKEKSRSKGAQKNQEEYEEKKVKTFAKVTATRDILAGLGNKILTVSVPVVMDCRHDDGSISPELIDLEFKVKRLTESQVNHLINRKLASKTDSELTDEEYMETTKFRSQFLATVIIEPETTVELWYDEVPAVVLTAVFDQVNKVLNNINDLSLFQ